VGGDAPISVQSMTNTDTRDASATLAQITALADAGCEIVRVAIPSRDALPGFAEICSASPLPVVADVHFDHTIAVDAAGLGVHAPITDHVTVHSLEAQRPEELIEVD